MVCFDTVVGSHPGKSLAQYLHVARSCVALPIRAEYEPLLTRTSDITQESFHIA